QLRPLVYYIYQDLAPIKRTQIGLPESLFRNRQESIKEQYSKHEDESLIPKFSDKQEVSKVYEWIYTNCPSFRRSCYVITSVWSSWFCIACIFENKPTAEVCEMCKAKKSTLQNQPLSNNVTLINSHSLINTTQTDRLILMNSATSLNPSLTTTYMSMNIRDRRHRDEAEAERKFRTIIERCRRTNTHFVDDEFPHSPSSLGDSYSQNNFEWVRISKFCSSFRNDDPTEWTVMSSPEPSDIEQGLLGNCWLVTALSLISERPRMLQHILLTQNINDEGVYLVRLCHNGLWKTIIVDDSFPCYFDDMLLFSKARRRQLYIPLIEKACAKLFGSYSKLISGQIEEGLQLFTGAPCDHIDLENDDEPIDSDLVWAKLLSSCQANLLIGASTSRTDVNKDVYDQFKVHGNHAFSILAAHALDNDLGRFVLLRDPHAHSCYTDERVTPEVLQILRTVHKAHRSSGAFWMEWSKFLLLFSKITISTYVGSHFDIREQARFNRSPTDSISVFYFHVPQTMLINVSMLYHRRDRDSGEILTQSFILGNAVDESMQTDERNLILHSQYGPCLAWFGSLRPGLYFIIPFSISFWNKDDHEQIIDGFTLVIQSSVQIEGLLGDGSPTFLADSLIAYLMKNCKEPAQVLFIISIFSNLGILYIASKYLYLYHKQGSKGDDHSS
ncbi:unnamed protein product, partial [Rotaria sordida]